MNHKKFGIFVSIKHLAKNIDLYKEIAHSLQTKNIKLFKQDLLDLKKMNSKDLLNRTDSIVEGTKRQIRGIDFAIADFSEKSRFVFFQTITALESKIPVLCICLKSTEKNFPKHLLSYGSDFIQFKTFIHREDLLDTIMDYIEKVEPPKRRFNVVLKTNTLKQMGQLCSEMEISKAELIRRLVAKEYRGFFGEVDI